MENIYFLILILLIVIPNDWFLYSGSQFYYWYSLKLTIHDSDFNLDFRSLISQLLSKREDNKNFIYPYQIYALKDDAIAFRQQSYASFYDRDNSGERNSVYTIIKGLIFFDQQNRKISYMRIITWGDIIFTLLQLYVVFYLITKFNFSALMTAVSFIIFFILKVLLFFYYNKKLRAFIRIFEQEIISLSSKG